MKSLWLLVCLFAVLVLPVGTFDIGEETTPAGKAPVVIEITARRDVADGDRDAFEDAIIVALATAKCPVRIAGKDEKARLKLVLQLDMWREHQAPGGADIFDPRTGQTRRGVRREIEVRYKARVLDVQTGKALVSGKSSFVQAAQTRSNPLWDPYVQAMMRARAKAAKEVLGWICKADRKARREERRRRRRKR